MNLAVLQPGNDNQAHSQKEADRPIPHDHDSFGGQRLSHDRGKRSVYAEVEKRMANAHEKHDPDHRKEKYRDHAVSALSRGKWKTNWRALFVLGHNKLPVH